jgi:hypothetical protein
MARRSPQRPLLAVLLADRSGTRSCASMRSFRPNYVPFADVSDAGCLLDKALNRIISNRLVSRGVLQPEWPTNVRPCRQMSFRHIGRVPSKVRVFENRRSGQYRSILDMSHCLTTFGMARQRPAPLAVSAAGRRAAGTSGGASRITSPGRRYQMPGRTPQQQRGSQPKRQHH